MSLITKEGKFIHLKLDWDSFHRWKKAPPEVKFLRHWHRHKFYCEIEMEVFHDDRELEFFMVLKYLKSEVIPAMKDQMAAGTVSSCEQQAEFIATELRYKYGERTMTVRVFEDNENGGGVWRRR